MKASLFFPLFTVAFISIAADADFKPVKLVGQIANSNSKYALLNKMDDESSKPDTVFLKEDGTFDFSKQIDKPCYYYFSIPKSHLICKVFLENGTSTTLKADMKKPQTYDVTGDLESTYDFSEKEDKMYDTFGDPLKFKSFKEYEKAIMAAKDTLLIELAKEKSEGFKQYEAKHLEDFIEMGRMSYIAVFLKTKKGFDRDNDYNAYMKSINLEDKANIANGKSLNYIYWKAACINQTNEHLSYPMLQIIKKEIKDKSIAGELAMGICESYFGDGPDKNVDKTYALATELLPKNELDKIMRLYKSMRSFSEGSIAPDFDMFTLEGKKVSLSSLKDKVVFMDIWATWCGPCRQEIPYMAKLAAHYKNNPKIRFVSVSVDNNVQSWKAMIAKDKPQWTQLIATDKTSKLGTLYHIDGIPRFMMFDKQGRIITINAPRPSEDNIYEFIDKNL